MSAQTEANRVAALSILEKNGMPWTRVGRGQRIVVHFQRRGRPIRALVKVASLGSAMVTTDRDAEDAKISGFDADVDHVLFAVGEPGSAVVSAYLVPIEKVEAAYRTAYKAWRGTHQRKAENTTWVLWFNDRGVTPEGNGFAKRWAEYLIGTTETGAAAVSDDDEVADGGGSSVIEDAKRLIAGRLGVSPAQVKIVIEY